MTVPGLRGTEQHRIDQHYREPASQSPLPQVRTQPLIDADPCSTASHLGDPGEQTHGVPHITKASRNPINVPAPSRRMKEASAMGSTPGVIPGTSERKMRLGPGGESSGQVAQGFQSPSSSNRSKARRTWRLPLR